MSNTKETDMDSLSKPWGTGNSLAEVAYRADLGQLRTEMQALSSLPDARILKKADRMTNRLFSGRFTWFWRLVYGVRGL